MIFEDITLYYTLFVLLFVFLSPFLIDKFASKLLKKHAGKRKTVFSVLAFIALFLLWIGMDNGFSDITAIVLWSLHFICFLVYCGMSLRYYIEDKNRIIKAEERRKRRECKK